MANSPEAPNTPAKSESQSSKSAPPRETLKSLRNHVDRISIRLERANLLTQKSVHSLHSAFKILEQQTAKLSNSNPEVLTDKVTQLTERLSRTVDEARAAVAADLKAALADPNISGLSLALEQADTRLTQMELAQADALSKVNAHIADMAKAIDARFKQEAKSRKLDIEAAAKQLTARMETLESQSAAGIKSVGDNLVDVSTSFVAKLDKQAVSLREKLAEIATQTDQNLKAQNHLMERRIESVEEMQRNLDAYTERSMANLAARIDSLEYGLSTLPPSDAEDMSARAHSDDAFTPDAEPKPAPVPDNPYAELEPAAHEPVEPEPFGVANDFGQPDFNAPVQPQPLHEPHVQAPQFQEPIKAVPYSPPPSYSTPGPAAAQSYAQNQAPAFDYQIQNANPYALDTAQPYQPPMEFTPQLVTPDYISDADLPYENPAYAEAGFDAGLSRPGDTEKRSKKSSRKKASSRKKTKVAKADKPKSSVLTGRNLRVIGLSAALATVGYMALRGYMEQNGGFPGFKSGDKAGVENTISNVAPIGSSGEELMTTDTIGQYPDNLGAVGGDGALTNPDQPQGASLGAPSKASLSLEQAAKDGNPVAQFQLGISYLEAGRKDDAVKYIRAAANDGLPAAQYRLAKLYEAGIGVSADPDMARQLTERAARQGNRIAMHDLALFYAEGRGGVDMDIATAASWFEKAAQRGVVDSQFNLGVLNESGQGVPKDVSNAYNWYAIAARQGDQFAKERLEIIKADLTPEEIAALESRVSEFKPVPVDEAANGIFRNVPWNMPGAGDMKPSADLVRDAQALLARLGYDVGKPDGAMGPRTRSAIISFQRDGGLPETGQVSAQLIDRLQAAAGA